MSRDARTDNWIVSATYTVPLASGYALALITAMTVGEHTLTTVGEHTLTTAEWATIASLTTAAAAVLYYLPSSTRFLSRWRRTGRRPSVRRTLQHSGRS